MEMLIAAFVLAWLFMRAKDAVAKEWRHTRDGYRHQITRDHGDWSPGRVNRAARWRARGYWWNEITSGFPTFRAGWTEHRLLAETERAEAAAAGETRLRDLRERLAAARERAAALVAPDPDETPELPAVHGDPEPPQEPYPAATPDGPEPEPWTTDAAPPNWAPVETRGDARPHDSYWLRPGERRCEGCGGRGSWHGATCPACRGWGSAPPDPTCSEAAPGTICTSCGNPGTGDDPVLDDPHAPVHRSHATERTEEYNAALDGMRAAEAPIDGAVIGADHDFTEPAATGGGDEPSRRVDGSVYEPAEVATLDRESANWAGDDGGARYPSASAAEEANPGWVGSSADYWSRLPRTDYMTDAEYSAAYRAAAADGTLPPPRIPDGAQGQDTDTGGTEVTTLDTENADTPFEGMQGALGTYAANARRAAEEAQDNLIAYAVTHGFDRDAATMAELQQVADAAEAAALAAEGAQRGLVARHAEGAEYHANGADANASAFRPA